jgi:hypothetical protein
MAPAPTTAQENAAFILKDMRLHAQQKGVMDPKMNQFFNELEITLANRFALSEDQGRAMRDLFTYRKDAAKKVTDNVLEIGHKASQSELDLYAAAEKFKLETATKAAGANLSNLNIIEEKKAGWSGFWTIAADLCRGIGFDMGANWCQERADANKPKILTANLEEINRLKSQVAIDTTSPIARAMGVFPSAVASLDPDTARVGPAAGAQMQTTMDAARAANTGQAPTHIAPMPSTAAPASVPVPSGAASAGSVEQMARQILEGISKKGTTLDAAVTKKIVQDVVLIDRSGTKDGKLNTDAEFAKFRDALTKRVEAKELSSDQAARIREGFGVPAAPQPS